MSKATDKVLEIARRQANTLTPAEMAHDLATEGWQRRQEDKKKRDYAFRDDDKKIKETEKSRKSNIGEEVLNELRAQTLRSYVQKAVKSSSKADSQGDKKTLSKRYKGVNKALEKIQSQKQ